MREPTYEELQRKVEELERIVNFKISPQEFYFDTRDLVYFKGYKDWSLDLYDKKIEDLTGYKLEDFLDRKIKWLDIVYEHDREIARNAVRQALKTDKYYLAEYRIVRKQGDLAWIKIRGFITCDSKGEFLSVRGVLNDITLEKYGELSFESARGNVAWTNSLRDGLYIISKDHRIVFMNQTLIDLVGDHVGELCHKALFGRETPCPWSVMDQLDQEGACFIQEYHLPQTGRIFQVRSVPIKLQDGSIGKLGHLKDITETRKLELEVEEFAGRQRAIEDAADRAELGIFILQDHEGIEARFRYANEAFSRITGYETKELLEKGLAALISPETMEAIMEHHRHRQQGEVLDHAHEIDLVRGDGRPITAYVSFALSSHEGRAATIGFLRDITERKKGQKALWRSQRLASIGRLAAEIAHEMNNPLTSVLTFSKLVTTILKQEPFPIHRQTELQEYVAFLQSETERCANISRNLLDFSRQSEIEIRENHINEILEKTLTILRHRAGLDEINIVTSYAEDLPVISCDFKRLQQAFINVLWNAIEAMPAGGVLSVSTGFDRKQNVIEVHISDTGVGIPEAEVERIFEPFYTTKSEGRGVGLGLSVAYGIVRQHQGELHVQSKVGQGTHFTIQVPVGARQLAIESQWDEDYVFEAAALPKS
ncbi:MAG: PAS domain S-box protein [Deltaproteobacteria bacterium]|nr:MAG: PAS domain S-box protein [Deltaproteobacteria bacterium]